MNRHNRFYAELEENLEDDFYDEDDYDYDEEYYEEEAAELYPEEAGEEEHPPAPRNTHSAFTPDEPDFDLLDSLLPALYNTWKTAAPRELPLLEAEAVHGLREANYDTAASVPLLVAQRVAKKQTASVRSGVLKVGGTKKVSEAAKPAVSPAGGSANALSSNAPPPVAESSARAEHKASHKAKGGHRDVQPDTSKLDCTFVIAGHVDAGKSTTLGHLLLFLGQVNDALVDRNEKDGKKQNKESFKYAWLLDQSEEERRRGVTIDCGSFAFETAHRRVNIIDAPGHKDFVLSMISGATQADAALLVVTAGTSEFETGLRYGTKDHLLILKTLGVGSIIVVVNKMDSVGYSKDRYDYVVQELKLLLKQNHMRESQILGFCPVSGIVGTNLVEVDHEATPWYNGPSLLDLIDSCPIESRLMDAALRLSLQDVVGNTLYARVESGKLYRGDTIVFAPADVKVSVKSINKPSASAIVPAAFAGDAVEISTSSSLIGLYPGCVGCDLDNMISFSTDFEAHIQTFATLSKAILPGATFTLVVHALAVPVKVLLLISKMDSKGNWSKGMVKCIPAASQAVVVFRAESKIALEPADVCRALGRFVLQQEGGTVAGGLVRRVMT